MSIFVFQLGFHYITQADFSVLILLPQPLKCWVYRYAQQSSIDVENLEFLLRIGVPLVSSASLVIGLCFSHS